MSRSLRAAFVALVVSLGAVGSSGSFAQTGSVSIAGLLGEIP